MTTYLETSKCPPQGGSAPMSLSESHDWKPWKCPASGGPHCTYRNKSVFSPGLHQENHKNPSLTIRMFSLFLWDRTHFSVREKKQPDSSWVHIMGQVMAHSGSWSWSLRFQNLLCHGIHCDNMWKILEIECTCFQISGSHSASHHPKDIHAELSWDFFRSLSKQRRIRCRSGLFSDSFYLKYFHPLIYSTNIYQAPVLHMNSSGSSGIRNNNKATSLLIDNLIGNTDKPKIGLLCHMLLVFVQASLGAQRGLREPSQGFREDFLEDKKELVGWRWQGGLPGKGTESEMSRAPIQDLMYSVQ